MKRIVAASCDAKFYPMAQEMIESVRQTSGDEVDEILFFDLGLQAQERRELDAGGFVRVLDYPAWLAATVYEDFLTPGMFAWKTYALREAARHGESILYMDCGCVALNSLRPIFRLIERDEAFFVRDVHSNEERTHDTCFSIMNATASERAASQIDAGVIGYRAKGKFAPVFEEGFAYAKNRACIFGDAVRHRHDQSIYSILAERHGVSVMHPYGREVHWQGIETREQIIWQHRGKWPAFRRLRERGEAAVAGRRIAVFGAGKHTQRFLATMRNLLEPRHAIVGILDDAAAGGEIGGIEVRAAEGWQGLLPDVVVVSSDAHEEAMMERGREVFAGVEVWGVYGGE